MGSGGTHVRGHFLILGFSTPLHPPTVMLPLEPATARMKRKRNASTTKELGILNMVAFLPWYSRLQEVSDPWLPLCTKDWLRYICRQTKKTLLSCNESHQMPPFFLTYLVHNLLFTRLPGSPVHSFPSADQIFWLGCQHRAAPSIACWPCLPVYELWQARLGFGSLVLWIIFTQVAVWFVVQIELSCWKVVWYGQLGLRSTVQAKVVEVSVPRLYIVTLEYTLKLKSGQISGKAFSF